MPQIEHDVEARLVVGGQSLPVKVAALIVWEEGATGWSVVEVKVAGTGSDELGLYPALDDAIRDDPVLRAEISKAVAEADSPEPEGWGREL
jgi:hypothetical protein